MIRIFLDDQPDLFSAVRMVEDFQIRIPNPQPEPGEADERHDAGQRLKMLTVPLSGFEVYPKPDRDLFYGHFVSDTVEHLPAPEG